MAKRIWFTFWGCLLFSLLAAQEPPQTAPQRALPEWIPPPPPQPPNRADTSSTRWPKPKPISYYDFAFWHFDPLDSIQQGYFRQVDLHIGTIIPFFSRGPWQPGLIVEPLSRFARYSYRQDSRDISPDSASHDREWLKVYAAALGLNSRFLFTDWNLKRPGLALDLYACANLPYYTALGFVDKGAREIKRTKTVWRGLTPEISFIAGARFSFRGIGIVAEYRLTPYFSGDSPVPNLPRLTYGFSLTPPNDK